MSRGDMVRAVIRGLGEEVGAEHVARCAVAEALRADPKLKDRVVEVLPELAAPGPLVGRVRERMLRALLLEHGWELGSVHPMFESWAHPDWEGRQLIVPTDPAASDYVEVVEESFRAFVMLEHGSVAARVGFAVSTHLDNLTT